MLLSWIFLAVCLFGLAMTLNAFRPIYRPGTLALASFFAGWLTKELALHHIAWQMVATLIFVALGALDHWPGWVALGVAPLSWSGKWWLHRQSLRTPEVVEQALRAGLGANYRERVISEQRGALLSTVDARRLAAVFPIRRADVERIRNVVYSHEGRRKLRLDIYRSKRVTAGAPCLLYVHGGGWVIGNKNQQGLMTVNRLAAEGWVCFSINYRLSPRATFPDMLIDVKRAIAWIREYGATVGADPNFLVACGGSAGGHLSALAALTANDPEYQPGFEAVDTTVHGLVSYYGVYDFLNRHGHWPHDRAVRHLLQFLVMKRRRDRHPECYHKASPMSRMHGEAPPALLVHGSHDSLAPVRDARAFYRQYVDTATAKVVYCELPGAQHAFEIFPSIRSTHVVDGVARFLATIYSDHLAQRDAESDDLVQRLEQLALPQARSMAMELRAS